MSLKEWNSGRGLGTKCVWSDQLGPAFEGVRGFADSPQKTERMLSDHLGCEVTVERIQEASGSGPLGQTCFFAYTPKT